MEIALLATMSLALLPVDASLPGALAQGGTPPHYFISQLGLSDGDVLYVPSNAIYTIDMEPTANLGGVFVEGVLEFSPALDSPELRASWILVTGTLRMGTSVASPVPEDRQATITLIRDATNGTNWFVDPAPYAALLESPASSEYADLMDALADRGLVVYATGKLRAYGWDKEYSWTELAESAPADASMITLDQPLANLAEWNLGDSIVIASTDFDWDQAEQRTITSLSMNTGNPAWTDVGLSSLLDHPHHSAVEAAVHNPSDPAWQIEERAEVGILTRNVVIRAQEWNGTGWQDGTGAHGHVLLARGTHTEVPEGKFWWVRFEKLGRIGKMGRYPLHFHLTGDQDFKSWIKFCAFVDNFNKFFAIHDTQSMEASGNVGYLTFGNGFYLEDELATDITLVDNLGIGTRPPEWFPSQAPVGDEDKEPGVFWYVSADNRIEGNRAAGSSHYGFWYSPTANDEFLVDGINSYFRSNIAHSNGHHGIYQDKVALDPASPRAWPWYPAVENGGTGLYDGPFQMEDSASWKNRRFGVWIRSYGRIVLNGLKVADNRGGYYPASSGIQDVDEYEVMPNQWQWRSLSWITVQNSLAIGETDNRGDYPLPGTTTNRKHEEEAQRTLPQPVLGLDDNRPHAIPWAYLTGVDVYDGLVELRKMRFARFEDFDDLDYPVPPGQADRPAAAISQVAYDSIWAEDPRNFAHMLEFDESGAASTVDHRVAFRQVATGAAANMIRNTIVHDADGSLNASGFSDAFVVPESPFLVEGVTYSDADPFDGVWEVNRANAEYAQLVVQGEFQRDGIGWIGVAHGYPAPANPVFQFVRTVLGGMAPGGPGQSRDQFPFNLPLNQEYFLDFRDDAKQLISPHDQLDLIVRFASEFDQWMIIGFPWDDPSPVVTDNGSTRPFVLSYAELVASTDSKWFYDDPDSNPLTQNFLLIKIFTKLRSGGSSSSLLTREGTENQIEVR